MIHINAADNVYGENRVWLPFMNNQPKAKYKIKTLKNRHTDYVKEIKCKEVNILSDKCYICSGSNNNIAIFTFESIVNQLEWVEHRCLNKACEQILQYTSLNSKLKYPRILANLCLQIKEIESIYEALQVFKIKIHSDYKFLLNGYKIVQKPHSKRMVLGFNKNTCIFTCGHEPNHLIIKDKENKYFELNGKYSIQCNKCTASKRHQDINRFHCL